MASLPLNPQVEAQMSLDYLRFQAQEAAQVLLRKGLDLPDPALQGRKRLKASGKKELEAEAQEIALKIMSSHKEAEAEVREGEAKATEGEAKASAAKATEGQAKATEGEAKATAAKATEGKAEASEGKAEAS